MNNAMSSFQVFACIVATIIILGKGDAFVLGTAIAMAIFLFNLQYLNAAHPEAWIQHLLCVLARFCASAADSFKDTTDGARARQQLLLFPHGRQTALVALNIDRSKCLWDFNTVFRHAVIDSYYARLWKAMHQQPIHRQLLARFSTDVILLHVPSQIVVRSNNDESWSSDVPDSVLDDLASKTSSPPLETSKIKDTSDDDHTTSTNPEEERGRTPEDGKDATTYRDSVLLPGFTDTEEELAEDNAADANTDTASGHQHGSEEEAVNEATSSEAADPKEQAGKDPSATDPKGLQDTDDKDINELETALSLLSVCTVSAEEQSADERATSTDLQDPSGAEETVVNEDDTNKVETGFILLSTTKTEEQYIEEGATDSKHEDLSGAEKTAVDEHVSATDKTKAVTDDAPEEDEDVEYEIDANSSRELVPWTDPTKSTRGGDAPSGASSTFGPSPPRNTSSSPPLTGEAAAVQFWQSLGPVDQAYYAHYLRLYNTHEGQYTVRKAHWDRLVAGYPFGNPALGRKYPTWESCVADFTMIERILPFFYGVTHHWNVFKEYKISEAAFEFYKNAVKEAIVPEIKGLLTWDEQFAKREAQREDYTKRVVLVVGEDEDAENGVEVTQVGSPILQPPDLKVHCSHNLATATATSLKPQFMSDWHFEGDKLDPVIAEAAKKLGVKLPKITSKAELERLQKALEVPQGESIEAYKEMGWDNVLLLFGRHTEPIEEDEDESTHESASQNDSTDDQDENDEMKNDMDIDWRATDDMHGLKRWRVSYRQEDNTLLVQAV
ncbi:hypothetical protein N0V83_004763 [Neocucurbitaria cava]|uniref:Uncharacterized protein n=1 Tax=Neocucurbitaria cava TaxID=798079 RepID=A0A9W8Y9R3_9PLEO|nr:hypothetical protein N0V83_004763 [Neocucurbitaria cava]